MLTQSRVTRALIALWVLILCSASPAFAGCPDGQEAVDGLPGCYYKCPPDFKRTAACTCVRDKLETNCDKYGLSSAKTMTCSSTSELWGGLCYYGKCGGTRTASCTCEKTRTVTGSCCPWTDCGRFSSVFGKSCPKDYKRTAVCTCEKITSSQETYLDTDCDRYGSSTQPARSCPSGTEDYGDQCYRSCPAGAHRTAACTCNSGYEVVTDCSRFGNVTAPIKPAVACTKNLRIAEGTPLDVTFLVTTDLHFGSKLFSPTSQQLHVQMVNSMKNTAWPTDQGFLGGGGAISPSAVVLTGDLTGYGHEAEQYLFREFWEPGRSRNDMPLALRTEKHRPEGVDVEEYNKVAVPVDLPVWVGIGNHDRYAGAGAVGRWRDYITQRMDIGCGDVVNIDRETSTYSWNWGKLHLIQLHEFGYGTSGSTGLDKGFARSMSWLGEDLARHARDGRPVIIFQHYSFTGTESLKSWGADDRAALRAKLKGYNVIAIFAGHDHTPNVETVDGIPVFVGSTGGEEAYKQLAGIHAVRVTSTSLDVGFFEWCPTAANGDFAGCASRMAVGNTKLGLGPIRNASLSRHISLVKATGTAAPPPVATRPPDGRYLLKNASDGASKCLIFSGNGTATYPSRHDWGAGGEFCGFPGGKPAVLANQQAVFSLVWLEGDSYLLKNASDGASKCLIFSGNGTATYPSRHDWGAGGEFCGFPGGKPAVLANQQAIWHLTAVGDGAYTLRNDSGGQSGCLIFAGNGTATYPSRHNWGAGGELCGFPGGKGPLLANKQAVITLVPLDR